jgi:hypothetical protein
MRESRRTTFSLSSRALSAFREHISVYKGATALPQIPAENAGYTE